MILIESYLISGGLYLHKIIQRLFLCPTSDESEHESSDPSDEGSSGDDEGNDSDEIASEGDYDSYGLADP